MDHVCKVWAEKVFKLLLDENKIDQTLVDQMKSWAHSGFSVDASVYFSECVAKSGGRMRV